MGSPTSNDKLAVLIDADNAKAALAPQLLTEITRYGTANIKRAYGDWTTPRLANWKEVLHTHAIQPIQQFSYTSGKNSTDSALIIDAMDLLHTGHLNGFCIVSSDSDFTRLATRIREAGLIVYGLGEKKTPQPFVAACDKFIFTEILEITETPIIEPAVASPRKLIKDAVIAGARDNGWVSLGALGSLIQKSDPSFDPRNYGFPKLSGMMRKQPFLEIKDIPMGDGSTNSHLYVRIREAA